MCHISILFFFQKIQKHKKADKEIDRLHLESNPLNWTVEEVVQFILKTDCATLANIFSEQASKLGSCMEITRQLDYLKSYPHSGCFVVRSLWSVNIYGTGTCLQYKLIHLYV